MPAALLGRSLSQKFGRLRLVLKSGLSAELLVGLLGGVAVVLLTAAASRSDIGGPGWTLRGNGALIVLFGLVPSLLAAGWVWLAERSPPRGVVAGLVMLVLELAFGFSPILLGASDPGATLKPAVAVLILALIAGLAVGRVRRRRPVLVSLGLTAVAILITLLPTGAAYLLVPILLPVLVATPSLATHWTGALAAQAATLTVAMLVGTIGGQYLLGSG